MTSSGVTPQPYLPKPSGTVSASSMKCTVPLGSPVVPEVKSSAETAIRSRRTGSSPVAP